jgi:hypothetical protein
VEVREKQEERRGEERRVCVGGDERRVWGVEEMR